MITKSKQENIYYLDRDTDILELVDRMEKKRRQELILFLENEKGKLQSKVGDFRTIKETTKVENSELDKMNYFFRTAVVPYYYRQEYSFWEDKLPTDKLIKATNEMKKRVGFVLYTNKGKQTNEVNSILTFKNTLEFNEFLNALEEVCFNDNGYMYPKSEHYNKLIELKGREGAKAQVLQELIKYTKNKYPTV